jgi:tetratricopeptide (TPR) repeat protein
MLRSSRLDIRYALNMDAEDLYKKCLSLEAAGEHEKAATFYRKLVRGSEDPRFHIAFGVCLQHLGRWRESLDHFRRGITLKPHYCEGDARLMLATSFLKVGLKNRAIEQWKIVVSMESEYPSYDAVQNEAKKMLAQYAT